MIKLFAILIMISLTVTADTIYVGTASTGRREVTRDLETARRWPGGFIVTNVAPDVSADYEDLDDAVQPARKALRLILSDGRIDQKRSEFDSAFTNAVAAQRIIILHNALEFERKLIDALLEASGIVSSEQRSAVRSRLEE